MLLLLQEFRTPTHQAFRLLCPEATEDQDAAARRITNAQLDRKLSDRYVKHSLFRPGPKGTPGYPGLDGKLFLTIGN
jgi:hypothetical protein